MLADERARALGEQLRGPVAVPAQPAGCTPDTDVFPDFDHNLREALQRETEMLFETIVREDRPLTELLDADYTFLNERLARHYGMPALRHQFRRVTLTDTRRGLLGHGSILTLTSYPTAPRR